MQPCVFCENTSRDADMLKSFQSGRSEHAATIPHQVCQVGLLSTHELPRLANGSDPVINCLVEILPDILLQVVPRKKEKYKPSYKIKQPQRSGERKIKCDSWCASYRLFSRFAIKYMAAAPTYFAKKPS